MELVNFIKHNDVFVLDFLAKFYTFWSRLRDWFS
jgi:hypothetical protein